MPPQTRHTESSILQSYLLTPSTLPTIIPYNEFLKLVPTQHRSHPNLKGLYRDLQFQRNIDIDTVRQNIEHEVARGVTLKSQLARRIAAEQGRGESTGASERAAKGKKRKRASNAADTDDEGEDEAEFAADDDDLHDRNEIAIDTTYHNSTLHPAHTDPLLPQPHNHPLTAATRRYHTTSTLNDSLNSACTSLEAEIVNLETESAQLLAEVNEIVGSMSDLRYGRFARPVSLGGEGTAGLAGNGETLEDEIVNVLKGLEQNVLRSAAR